MSRRDAFIAITFRGLHGFRSRFALFQRPAQQTFVLRPRADVDGGGKTS
jgi:hypothetical protein